MQVLFENIHVIGLMIQAFGAALIGLLCLMLNRIVHRPALTAWYRGWLSLALALMSLLIEQTLPATAAVTLPLYLFGEYLFGFWIIEGCGHFGGRGWPASTWSRVVAPLAVISIAVPQLIGDEFRAVFSFQSLILSGVFAAALYTLGPIDRGQPASPGRFAMRVALLLLAVIFLSYVPIFSANWLWNSPLPMNYLLLSSAAHLILEFLLGFGGAVLILEQAHHGLAAKNNVLSAEYEKFRAQAERDALTNAYNRHAFFRMLEHFSATDMPIHGCAAMIDLDGLKQINDNFGHLVGDAAIIRVAQAITRVSNDDDRLFRWGGDEFLLVSLNQDSAAVLMKLEQLNPNLATPDSVAVQVSFGVVAFGAVEELRRAVKIADTHMYAHKRERAAMPRRAEDDRFNEQATR